MAELIKHLEWGVEAIGSLGPAIVAWLVYKFGKQQHLDSLMNTNRQHRLEMQNFRLAVLDRRVRVVNSFDEIYWEYMQTSVITDSMIERARLLVNEGRFIFNPELMHRLDRCADLLVKLQIQRNITERYRGKGMDEQRNRFVEESFATEDELVPLLMELHPLLPEATRLEEPPLP